MYFIYQVQLTDDVVQVCHISLIHWEYFQSPIWRILALKSRDMRVWCFLKACSLHAFFHVFAIFSQVLSNSINEARNDLGFRAPNRVEFFHLTFRQSCRCLLQKNGNCETVSWKKSTRFNTRNQDYFIEDDRRSLKKTDILCYYENSELAKPTIVDTVSFILNSFRNFIHKYVLQSISISEICLCIPLGYMRI